METLSVLQALYEGKPPGIGGGFSTHRASNASFHELESNFELTKDIVRHLEEFDYVITTQHCSVSVFYDWRYYSIMPKYGFIAYWIESMHLESRSSVWGGYPDGKVHGANMGPIWGLQDPGGPHVSPMNLAI